MEKVGFLAHRHGDVVAVAVRDVEPERCRVEYLDSSPQMTVDVREPIPLGHKVALKDLKSGVQVIEYGTIIGRTTKDVLAGDRVHVHNLKGERWV